MEPIIITTLASSAVSVLTPYLKKGAEAIVGEAGKDLWNLIKKPFTSDKDKILLEEFAENSQDQKLQDEMKIKLEEFLEHNPELVEELQELLPKTEEEVKKINIQNITGNNNVAIQDIKDSSVNIN